MTLHVHHLITDLSTGGAQQSLYHLLHQHQTRDISHSVTTLRSADTPIGHRIRDLNIPVTGLRGLRQNPPDILHTWLFHANIAGRIFGKIFRTPIVLSAQRNMTEISGWRKIADRQTAGWAHAHVCPSAPVADFVHNTLSVPRDRLHVIHSGVNLPATLPPGQKNVLRKQHQLPVDALLIGCVARLHPVKNHALLLDALTQLPDVHVCLVGDGPQRKPLEQRGQQLGLSKRIHFVGDQTHVDQWLPCFDVFVLSSRHEGLPNAVLEAAATGLPIVVTDSGGVRDIIRHKQNGLIVPAEDSHALAQAIQFMLEHPDQAKQWGAQARSDMEQHFQLSHMADRYQNLYHDLWSQHHGG